jgi:hypothetical protein
MKCAHCDKDIPDTAKVCGYCGHKVEIPTCLNCGETLPADAKICGYCGTPIEKKAAVAESKPAAKPQVKAAKPEPAPAKKVPVKAEQPQPVPVKAVPAKSRGKLPKWVKIAGLAAAAVVVLALVLFFAFSFVSPLPEDMDEPARASSGDGDSPSGGSIGSDQLDALAGTWSGSVGSSDGEFDITFRLKDGCSLYMVCGTFNVPEWGCSGDISFIDVNGDKFEFRASSKVGCGDNATSYEEWLRPVGSNELEYYSRGDYGVSQGTLAKQ